MGGGNMESAGSKRKATHALRDSTKRSRVDNSVIDPTFLSSDNEDDDSYSDHDDSDAPSDEDRPNTETPLTPHSPSSRKFPSELKTIKCTYEGCTKSFNRPARLASHIRSHTNERPFACSYEGCDKTYMEEKHLKQHVKGSHTYERNHKCSWEGCPKSFLTATRLRRHQAAHGGHERFRCIEYPPCNQTFRKHQTLQRHIRSDHLQLNPFPCLRIDPATQVQCTAGYDSAGALRKHEDRVHGALRFWCDECSTEGAAQPAGFSTKAQLAKHIRNEHANCLFCELKCSSERELQRHIETFHAASSTMPKRKQIPCTYPSCEKFFTKKYNLDVHVRTAHEGQRFICGQTDLSKSSKLELWNGLDGCGKDFVSKVNLEDHVRTQHLGLPSTVNARRVKKNGVGARPRKAKSVSDDAISALTGMGYGQDPARNIACDVDGCDWMFSRDYDLLQHKRSKHGLAPPPCYEDYAVESQPQEPLLAMYANDEPGLQRLPEGSWYEGYEQPYEGPPHTGNDAQECARLFCPHWNHGIIYDDYTGLGEMQYMLEQERRAGARVYPELSENLNSAMAFELGI